MKLEFDFKGLDEFIEAIKRNPEVVKSESGKFIKRATASYMSTILNNPWRIWQSGGGVPVRTGNLRDTHSLITSPWIGEIRPMASYAGKVHAQRPWLDYAFDKNKGKVKDLENMMAENIIKALSK